MIPLQQIVGRILSWLGIGVGSLILLALVLFGIAYAVNMRDEPLSPLARAFLQPPPNPCKPEENLYLALVGFGAPAGESVIAAGQARIDRYNGQLDALLRDPLGAPSDTIDPRGLQFQGKFEFPPAGHSFWSEIPSHRQEIERLLADNRELYARYLALPQLHGYFQTARPSTFVPIAYPPTKVRQMFLASVVLRMRSDDPRERRQALADLEADLGLWRVMLTADGTFVSKMLAIAYLHGDQQLLADAIADSQAPIPVGPEDAQAVAPLFPLDEWNIGEVFADEFRVQASILEQTHLGLHSGWTPPDVTGPKRWLWRAWEHVQAPFFKVNATENLFAEQMERLGRAAAPGASSAPLYNPLSSFAYNPLGKTLAAIALPGYDDYALRAWDGAAFQRLVRLSYEIRRQQIDVNAVPAFMKQHPEWSTHPGDERSFLWDSAAGTIRVQTLGKDKSGRVYFVHAWRPATRN